MFSTAFPLTLKSIFGLLYSMIFAVAVRAVNSYNEISQPVTATFTK